MCRAIQDLNSRLKVTWFDKNKIRIGSMDAIGLYPNLKLDESLKILQEMVMKSDMDFSDVEWQELAKYL